MNQGNGQLRRTALYRALHRSNLLMGGERGPMMLALFMSAGIALAAVNLPATLFGALLWFVSVRQLRAMAKADPDMTLVYRRQLGYARFYPAASTPWRKE